MKSIEEKINFFKENLELFDDDMDKYKYLLDQAKNAKKLAAFQEENRRLADEAFTENPPTRSDYESESRGQKGGKA